MSENIAKTILITGCTSGIGYETSLYLHELGYRLVLTGRDGEKLNALSEKVNCEVSCICDLSESCQINRLFECLENKRIKLDGMVHSAGYAANAPVRLLKEIDMTELMNLHYFAFMKLSKNFYKKIYSNVGASIVALSSFATVTCYEGSSMYAASKSAVNTAVSVMAKEFLKRGIRVNAILPAYVDTRMNKGLDELVDIRERQPLGLIASRQIAYLVEFLLSEKSKYITGALIPVSAGMKGI